jgi:hypothetical protein
MTRALVIGAIVAAIVAGAIWWARSQGASPVTPGPRRQQPGNGEEGRVILMALGQDWAKRFGCTEDELSDALITGANAALADRVGRETGVIDLRFDTPAGGTQVAATLLVTYASTGERATARLVLAWDDIPRSVRGDLLRAAGTPVFRKWRAGT